MPTTLRKVSCWPANEASGRSSAVAEEHTAKLAWALPPLKVAKASRTAFSRSAGKGWFSTQARISAPAAARARTSSTSRAARRALMRSCRPSYFKNSRKACAVVAKPVGTRTPWGSCEIISPRLAFLPPTTSTSLILRFSNGTTRAVASKRADMGKLQKLKPGLRLHKLKDAAGGRPCSGHGFAVVVVGRRGAWGEIGNNGDRKSVV